MQFSRLHLCYIECYPLSGFTARIGSQPRSINPSIEKSPTGVWSPGNVALCGLELSCRYLERWPYVITILLKSMNLALFMPG